MQTHQEDVPAAFASQRTAAKLGCSMRPNTVQCLSFRALSMVQIPPQLQIQPEVGRRAKILGQPRSRTWGHASPPVGELVNPLIRYPNRVGKLALSNSHGPQKLLQQHFARMCRRSMSRDTHGLASPVRINDNLRFRQSSAPHRSIRTRCDTAR